MNLFSARTNTGSRGEHAGIHTIQNTWFDLKSAVTLIFFLSLSKSEKNSRAQSSFVPVSWQLESQKVTETFQLEQE